MSHFLLIKSPEKIRSRIKLGPSKSIGNRLFIISKLSGNNFVLPDNSPDDLRIIQHALINDSGEINAGESGTALRFLIAYFALKGKQVRISGSGKLHERPVGPLVDALQLLGARIQYEGKAGYAPLQIHASQLFGGKVSIDAGKSSQFISALLLIAPYLKGGLEIELQGKAVSTPYTRLTLSMMKSHGAELAEKENVINVSEGSYTSPAKVIEADWSSAAFWYQAVALHSDAKVELNGLRQDSFQGDQVLIKIFEDMALRSKFDSGDLILEKQDSNFKSSNEIDLNDFPDLAPSVVLVCAEFFPNIRIIGLGTLPHKESDRIAALMQGLKQCGYKAESDGISFIQLLGKSSGPSGKIVINSHKDHRIAMAFAMMSCVFGEISISDPDCVIKSYPNFWHDLRKAGFVLEETEIKT